MVSINNYPSFNLSQVFKNKKLNEIINFKDIYK